MNFFSKKWLGIICIIVFIVIAFYGGSLSSKFLEETFHPKPIPILTPKFYPLGQFTVSIPGGNLPHYVMLEITIESSSVDAEKIILSATPLIKNAVMKLVETKNYAGFNKNGAIDSLQNELSSTLNKVLKDNHYHIDFSKVLLTRMIIQ